VGQGLVGTYQIVIKLYRIGVIPLLQRKLGDFMLSKFQHPCTLVAGSMPQSPCTDYI